MPTPPDKEPQIVEMLAEAKGIQNGKWKKVVININYSHMTS